MSIEWIWLSVRAPQVFALIDSTREGLANIRGYSILLKSAVNGSMTVNREPPIATALSIWRAIQATGDRLDDL